MKSTVIFADQSQEEKRDASSSQPKNNPNVTLSRDEYREVVKEAYKEGRKETMQEVQQKEQSLQATPDKKEESNEAIAHREEAKQEAINSETQKEVASKRKFASVAARQDIELLRTKSVFPFSLFPDTLIIDTTKITLARKQFFATENITTIPLKDIADVTVQTALFLASITMTYMPQVASAGMTKPIDVTLIALNRKAAMDAKNILKGAMVAKAEEIDISKLSPKEVKTVIEKFGQSEGIE